MKKLTVMHIILLMLISCIFFSESVWANENTNSTANSSSATDLSTVVRVGFPIQQGLTEINDAGKHFGYTVDYLNEVSKYTNWKYEFVQVDGNINEQLVTLLDMLKKGDIDLMGAMNYNGELGNNFLYPDYPYGTAYTIIAVNENNLSIIENDYQTLDGIRIASCPAFEKRLPSLQQYADIYGFSYELVEYDTFDEMVNSVLSNQTDACLQLDLNIRDGLHSIARFTPRPYYFALAPRRSDLLKELNNALYALSEAYPHLQTELYNRYFKGRIRFQMSESNTNYIKTLRPLRILFFDGNAPLQYVKDGKVYGAIKDFIDQLCHSTGIKYHPVIAKNYAQGLSLIKKGKVDLVANVSTSATLVSDGYLSLSMPYMDSHSIFVTHRGQATEDMPVPQDLSANTKQKMKELQDSYTGSAYLDSYIVSFYMRKAAMFDNLSINWSDIRNVRYAVGLPDHMDTRIIGIINNYINSLTAESMYELVYSNSHVPVHYSLSEAIYTYRWQIALLTLMFALLVYLFIQSRSYVARKRDQQETARFLQLAQLFNESLFEYNYDRDELAIQNNKVIFHGQSLLKSFTKINTQDLNESSQKYYETFLKIFHEKISNIEFELPLHQGSEWFRIQTMFTDENGHYALGRILNITSETTERQKLEEQAHSDRLTGLANRYMIERVVEQHISSGVSQGVFLLMDIDNFKQVNDIFGHMEGDALLHDFACHMNSWFRSNDLKGRIGGDEFIVFIPNDVDRSILKEKLQNFIDSLHSNLFSRYAACKVSVSIGVAYINDQILCYNDIYRKADRAMYQAKATGKDTFCIKK